MTRRSIASLFIGVSLTASSALADTVGDTGELVRPDIQNVLGTGTRGITPIQGVIKPYASAPSGGPIKLTEASFGQAFSPYAFTTSSGAPDSYAAEIVAQVRGALYPAKNSTRAQVEKSLTDGGTVFRYKYLLFSPNPGETDVTTHFQDMGDWFGQAERDEADLQIQVLREALAVSPLDTALRDLLLETYYDLAVAEMQFAKQGLAQIAAEHLGVVQTKPFAIDGEIAIYEDLVKLEERVLEKYAELLSFEMEGIDPSDFDEREKPGKPMGLYIFTQQQPYRNAIASEYVTDTGMEVIPEYDAANESAKPRPPENLVLFSGYKDYVTLLEIMGNYIQHQSVLAKLRGIRQGPDDLTKARNAIGKVLSETATDFLLLQQLPSRRLNYDFTRSTPTSGSAVIRVPIGHSFIADETVSLSFSTGSLAGSDSGLYIVKAPVTDKTFTVDILRPEGGPDLPEPGKGLGTLPVEFAAGDASGVNGAINGVEAAQASITGVRDFLNRDANSLGLDPNFLLLVKGQRLPNGDTQDSYDVLVSRLKGPNKPLTDALDKMADATAKYQNFRASVDKVVAELADVDDTYTQRYFEITGYDIDEVPGFDGYGKPGSGSELDQVEKTVIELEQRNKSLKSIGERIEKNVKSAQAALTIANGLDKELDAATKKYQTDTTKLLSEIGDARARAAAGNIVFDAALGIAGLDFSAKVTGQSVIIGLAGAGNAAIQKLSEDTIADREAQIEIVARNFENVLQKQDNSLVVNQARQEVNDRLTEQLSNMVEIGDNSLGLSQANAQRTNLLREIQRIAANRDGDTEIVRSSYYADPIQFVRSEKALILADSAFDSAQRAMFYTLRALEYKWQQKFVHSEVSGQGVRKFDSGTIFKLRNAAELDDLLTQFEAWNTKRTDQIDENRAARTTFISLRDHVLTPNPDVLNDTTSERAESGQRFDLEMGEPVSQQVLFQRLLDRGKDSAGSLNVDFDTSKLENVVGFFVGPNYPPPPDPPGSPRGSIAPGEWRDKISYIKVNVIVDTADDPPGTNRPISRAGSLTYGGQIYFRTRIPPCIDRDVHLPPGSDDGVTATDIPGEFQTAPFRYYTSPSFTDAFRMTNSHTASFVAAETGGTAKHPTSGEDVLGPTFQFDDFNQYSVAATRWRLTLFEPPTGWDVSKIKDIEFIIKHKSSPRFSPVCP